MKMRMTTFNPQPEPSPVSVTHSLRSGFPQSSSLPEKDWASKRDMEEGIWPWSLLLDMSRDLMSCLRSGTGPENWLFSRWSSERKRRVVKDSGMGPVNLLLESHIFFKEANWEKKSAGMGPENWLLVK